MSNEKSITESFGDSIVENTFGPVTETAEIVFDSCIDNGILKDIPIVQYAVSAYKIIDDIRGRFFLGKLQCFVNKFNAGLASENEIQNIKAKFTGNKKDEELSYIIIIIDRYLDIEKPALLSNLYLAYLDEKINWIEFCAYAEIVDKLLRDDLKYLIDNTTYITNNSIVPSELLRLTGVGLMNVYQNDSPFVSAGQGAVGVFPASIQRTNTKERIYERTPFGQKFVEIVNERHKSKSIQVKKTI